MTLTKFVSIVNIGRFQNYNAVGDVTLRRSTLIFAENGRGKSTLCAILRSLQSNDPAHVLGRTTLGSTTGPSIRLLTNNGTVSFRAGTWTQTLPHLAIFDSTFVAENVFSGDAVDLEHKRNLFRVIIGKSGVNLAKEVSDIDAEIRSLISLTRVLRAAIERHIPLGVDFDAFVALEANPLVDEKIAAKEKELEAVREATQLKARAGLTEIRIPTFPTGFDALLGRTISDLSTEAERRVSEHLALHEMQGGGERWVQEGIGYIRDDACPFCDQPLQGVDLIGEYRAFFGEAYNDLKDAVASCRKQLETLFGDRALADTEKPLASNEDSGAGSVAYPLRSFPHPKGSAPHCARFATLRLKSSTIRPQHRLR